MNKTTAILESKTKLTSTVFELIFKTDDVIKYTPGQYLFMQINEKQKRMYSILKSEGNLLTLIVDVKPGGIASKLFEIIEPGFETQFLYSFGELVLTDSKKPKLFIASGTGVVPVIAMLNELVEKKSEIQARLLWGIRYEEDNYLPRYFDNSKAPSIQISTCVTQPSSNYKGYIGRVTAAVKEIVFKPLLSQWEIYVIGSSVMVKETELILNGMGITDIAVERY